MTSIFGGRRAWIWTVLLSLIIAGMLGYNWYRHSDRWKKDHVLVELKPFQTSRGWGYNILSDGKVFIHQDVIPAIGGYRMFKTREDALKVGQVVYERALKNEVPMVTAKEVREMGVVPADSLQTPSAVEKR